ncbi:MAG TPA: GvpL/GvpF family gas vesicle protein [Gemmatirosa sp.]
MTPRRTEEHRIPEPGVRLYGVLSAVHADAGGAGRRIGTPTGIAAVELLRVRDLVAAIAPAPFAASPPSTAELESTHTIVATLFADRAILPAPPGAVFRSRAAVAAWLELHAAALAEALRYIEDRVEARVHATRPPSGVALPGASASAPITEVLRTLRRDAVAVLVLRDEARDASRDAAPRDAVLRDTARDGERGAADEPVVEGNGALQAAFLVERARWDAFASAVAREHATRPNLHLALTGPWPPYDFVRLELGA